MRYREGAKWVPAIKRRVPRSFAKKTRIEFLRATSRPSRLRGETLWVAGEACAGLLRGKSFFGCGHVALGSFAVIFTVIMDWFYAQNGRQAGPVTHEALVSMLQGGHVLPGDLVWREGMADWQPAATLPELAAAVPAATASLSYFNPLAGPSGPPIYAGFWMRFAAIIIDGIILWFVSSVINRGMGLEASYPKTSRKFSSDGGA